MSATQNRLLDLAPTPAPLETYRGPVLTPSPVTPLFLRKESNVRREAPVSMAGRRIHFMGAGGIGISALMEFCAARGAIVSGCDCGANAQTDRLRGRGIPVHSGHAAEHVLDCDELVHTAAVSPNHPEVAQARERGVLVRSRMNMLGLLMKGLRSVCVTGAHGKTTTTWMISQILISAHRDPAVLVGGIAPGLKSNLRIGRGEEFVVETDESDNRLHETTPTIPVLTNIDSDHLENFGSVEGIEEAMVRFMGSTDTQDPHAALIGCGDDVRVQRVLARASMQCRRPVLNYGFNRHNSLRAIHVESTDNGMGWRFDALGPFGVWQDVHLPMPGRHNVLNALAAIGVAWTLGINQWIARAALASVERVGRRFEIKCSKPVRVVDDYGHHPTEIALTLNAARASTQRRLGVLFQPHRYTRTAALMEQFASCFSAADSVFLLPVYSAGETEIAGANTLALANAVRAAGHPQVLTFDSRADAVAAILKWAREGDTIVTQGAGDVTRAANELAAGL